MSSAARSYGWQDDAACLTADPDLFFPARGDATKFGAQYTGARAICTGCPVKSECLDQALRDEAARGGYGRHGMFGGLTPDERARYARTLWRTG